LLHRSCLGDAGSSPRLAFRPASIPGREQFDLSPGQSLQMIALPWRIELLPKNKSNYTETKVRLPYRTYLCINFMHHSHKASANLQR
jgi:hypothetical protein